MEEKTKPSPMKQNAIDAVTKRQEKWSDPRPSTRLLHSSARIVKRKMMPDPTEAVFSEKVKCSIARNIASDASGKNFMSKIFYLTLFF